MKLSIIIPIYNEENTLKKILNKIENVNIGIDKEIIIVDDFSTDGTRKILKTLEKKYKIIYHDYNKGKGAALRTGFSHATGDLIIIQDADLEYNPNDYPNLIKPILDGEIKVVYGNRFPKLNLSKGFILSHLLGNKILSIVTSLLYLQRINDMETCYKVFNKEVIKDINLKANRFDIEPEITAKILKKGYKIKEIPISFNPRSFKEGKKITWKDGLIALWCLVKYRFIN